MKKLYFVVGIVLMMICFSMPSYAKVERIQNKEKLEEKKAIKREESIINNLKKKQIKNLNQNDYNDLVLYLALKQGIIKRIES